MGEVRGLGGLLDMDVDVMPLVPLVSLVVEAIMACEIGSPWSIEGRLDPGVSRWSIGLCLVLLVP